MKSNSPKKSDSDVFERAIALSHHDEFRPRIHFHAPAQWMNDPNGPFFHRGFHHLFYQFNPDAEHWEQMHWGHARSRDGVNWQHLPIALAPSPEAGEKHVYSGCLARSDAGEMLAFYTSIAPDAQPREPQQWAARALDDDLIAWEKLAQNPILRQELHPRAVNEWRDPFIFERDGQTWMALGGNWNNSKGGQGVVLLYRAQSADLLHWEYSGEMFRHPDAHVVNIECPNFFELNGRWVLLVSPHAAPQWFVGDLQGQDEPKFVSSQRGILDAGAYASNVWKDERGQILMVLCVRTHFEGRGWNGFLTLPRVLTLEADGHLLQNPLPALQTLREKKVEVSAFHLSNDSRNLPGVCGSLLEIEMQIDVIDAHCVGLRWGNETDAVIYDVAAQTLTLSGCAPVPLRLPCDKLLRLRVFLDGVSIEVFAGDGRAAISSVWNAPESLPQIAVLAEGGAAEFSQINAWTLRPARFTQG